MNAAPAAAAEADAVLILSVFATEPLAVGGLRLAGLPGPGRDAVIRRLPQLLGPGAPVVRVPVSVTDDRLLGGLDLAATLAEGRPVRQHGLLAQADGGCVVLSMAERLAPRTVASLTQVMDAGSVNTQRDGIAGQAPARFAVVALDESLADDEPLADALSDRLALTLSSDHLSPADLSPLDERTGEIATARRRLPAVTADDAVTAALSRAALALGIGSMRPLLAAVTAARIVAALAGRTAVTEEDAATVARLVLSPRARCLPAADEAVEPPPPARDETADDTGDDRDRSDEATPHDVVVAAAAAALPPGVLTLLDRRAARRRRARAGRSAVRQSSRRRGRPIGSIAGLPDGRARLNLLATLKAAAPWQRLRDAPPGRLALTRDDFRLTRFKHRAQTTTLFVVDASGSTARQRLAEVKGAVEYLLADCYVRRDEVGLLAFRGDEPELVLPPTRSLTLARRRLTDLPGGGATPLAAAIDAAADIALAEIRKGATPAVVFMTDGRGNVGRGGIRGDPEAAAQALEAARDFACAGLNALLIDTARRPQARARELADAMGADYLALPHVSSEALTGAVQATLAQRGAA
ncbi:MAG: magnesium chelatase subunit D [Pseudomonadota bacterium]